MRIADIARRVFKKAQKISKADVMFGIVKLTARKANARQQRLRAAPGQLNAMGDMAQKLNRNGWLATNAAHIATPPMAQAPP